jgi:hypothetical protein
MGNSLKDFIETIVECVYHGNNHLIISFAFKMDAIKDISVIAFNFANKFMKFIENFSLIIVLFLYLMKFIYPIPTEVFESHILQEVLNKLVAIVKQTIINHVHVGPTNEWMDDVMDYLTAIPANS